MMQLSLHLMLSWYSGTEKIRSSHMRFSYAAKTEFAIHLEKFWNAVIVPVLWYIYPILVIFSFADELIEEEEETLMQTSASNLSSPTEA